MIFQPTLSPLGITRRVVATGWTPSFPPRFETQVREVEWTISDYSALLERLGDPPEGLWAEWLTMTIG